MQATSLYEEKNNACDAYDASGSLVEHLGCSCTTLLQKQLLYTSLVGHSSTTLWQTMLQSRSKKPLIHALVELWAPDSMETDLHKECTSHSQLNLTRNICAYKRASK